MSLVSRTESSSLRDILVVVFKHLHAILLIFLVSSLTGVMAILLSTPQFTATSKLLVQVGREKTASFAGERPQGAHVSLIQRAQDINNQVEILRDPSLMVKLLPELKRRLALIEGAKSAPVDGGGWRQSLRDSLDFVKRQVRETAAAAGWSSTALTPDEALLLRLLDALDIGFPKDTDVIVVNFTWSDRDFAAYVVNALVRVFQEEHVRIHGVENSTNYYADQLGAARGELVQAEQAISEFMKAGEISNLDAEKTLALNALAQTDQELNLARIALENINQKLIATDRSYAKPGEWIETLDPELGEASIKALDESFVALSTERTLLLGRFSPGYPAVVNIEAQLRQLREAKYSALKARYIAKRGETLERIAALQAKIRLKRAELARLGDRTIDYQRVVRQRDQLEAQTAELRQKVDDLRVRDGLDDRVITSIKVISPAEPPIRPSSPRKALILVTTALAGLFVGLSFAVVAEFFNHTFRNEQDVARVLDLPLLATLPHVRRLGKRDGTVGGRAPRLGARGPMRDAQALRAR